MDVNTVELLTKFTWPGFRLAGLIMTMPLIGSNVIPLRLKAAVLVILTGFCFFSDIATPSISLFKLTALFVIGQEILLGVLIGFLLKMVFQVFMVIGDIVSQQIGCSMSEMFVPFLNSSPSILSKLYFLFCSLIFFSIDGHLMVVGLIIKSFQSIPIGEFNELSKWLVMIVKYSGIMINSAVLIALPLILSVLVVNSVFAIISRSTPQLNILSVGFPLMILSGVFLVSITLNIFSGSFILLFNNAISYLMGVV